MWPGDSALQMRYFMQDYLRSQPQWERRLWFSRHCWRSENKVASDLVLWEPKHGKRSVGGQARTFVDLLTCWRRTPRSQETTCQQRWMTGLAGERQPWWGRVGGGGNWGWPSSSSSSQVVVVAVAVGTKVQKAALACTDLYRRVRWPGPLIHQKWSTAQTSHEVAAPGQFTPLSQVHYTSSTH